MFSGISFQPNRSSIYNFIILVIDSGRDVCFEHQIITNHHNHKMCLFVHVWMCESVENWVWSTKMGKCWPNMEQFFDRKWEYYHPKMAKTLTKNWENSDYKWGNRWMKIHFWSKFPHFWSTFALICWFSCAIELNLKKPTDIHQNTEHVKFVVQNFPMGHPTENVICIYIYICEMCVINIFVLVECLFAWI